MYLCIVNKRQRTHKNTNTMKRHNENYSIYDSLTATTAYYQPWDAMHVLISVPATMIQNTINAANRHAGWARIIEKIAPVRNERYRYYSQAGAIIRVQATAGNIFAMLEELGIHQHTGVNYRANGTCWQVPERKVNYTHRAYRRNAHGALVSKLIEAHNAKQYRANGWHVVEI